MPDPIRHDDLTAYGTRLHAARLQNTLHHVLHAEPVVPGLLAATLAFIVTCQQADMDPQEVLDQIVQANDSDELDISDADWEALERRVATDH